MAGGRPKGRQTKKKQEFRAALRAYGEKLGVDPHFWMYDLLKKQGVRTELKLQAAKELAQYLQPKLRAVELSGNPDKPLLIGNPEERQSRIDTLLAKRDVSLPEPLHLVDPE